MLFTEFYFLLFLLVVFIIYYNINVKYRVSVLFAASIFFIGSFSIKILGFTLVFATINYFLGKAIEKAKLSNKGNRVFWIGIL